MSSLKYKTWSYILLTIVHGHISAAKTPSNITIFAHHKLIPFNISQYMYTVVCRHTIIKPERIYLYDYVFINIYKSTSYLAPIKLTSSMRTYLRWTNNLQLTDSETWILCEICCLSILTINRSRSFWDTPESAQTKPCRDMPLMIVFNLHPNFPLYIKIIQTSVIKHSYVDRTANTDLKDGTVNLFRNGMGCYVIYYKYVCNY